MAVPIRFPEANGHLTGGTAEEFHTRRPVEDLPVYRDGRRVCSCWKLSLRERLAAIVFGRVWLRVLSDDTHHPVSVAAQRTIFTRTIGGIRV